MDPRPLAELGLITRGRVVRELRPGGVAGPDVVIDSRGVTPGALFVALPGERVDGHDFVEAARAAGAGAALVAREVDVDLPQIVVGDTQAGLSELARAVVGRERARGLTVVGATGSAGKTSTKDLIAQILETAGPTVAPPGSFNNEIGAPLTACRVDRNTRFLVAEMGARGIGHVAELARVTPPTIGLVLNVGSAHLGEFGSADAIAQAKGELVEALEPAGWAVLNADDPRVLAMARRTRARLVAYSTRRDPSASGARLRVWASDITHDALQRHAFTLHAAGDDRLATSTRVTLRLIGDYHVANALAAAGVAVAAGLSVERVASVLSAATPRSRWRMELTERADGLVVLNDAYNANPEAMEAALGTLARLRRTPGRLVAVLGDMLELGEDSAEAHVRIGRIAGDLGIDEVVATGEFGPDVVEGYGVSRGQGRYFEARESLTDYLRDTLAPEDVVLVKASRGIGLERVAAALTDDGEGADA